MRALCMICGKDFDASKKHNCTISDLKYQNLHLSKLCDMKSNNLRKSEEFIYNNVWNEADKDKIKKLLLIINNSIKNNEFEIKVGNNE